MSDIKIDPAPRPEDDTSRASWRRLIAASLPEGDQADFEAREFVPCRWCSTAPGSPSLCRGCLANRQTITELRETRDAQLKLLVGVHRALKGAAHEASCLESRLVGVITAIDPEV